MKPFIHSRKTVLLEARQSLAWSIRHKTGAAYWIECVFSRIIGLPQHRHLQSHEDTDQM